MKTLHHSRKFVKPACSYLIALSLLSCGVADKKLNTQGISALTSSSSDFDPRLGESYDKIADSYLGSSCVKFSNVVGETVQFIPPKIGDLVIQEDASFESLSKAFSGGGELSLNLDAFQGSGSMQFANEMQSDSYSKTLSIFFNVESGEMSLAQQEDLVTLNKLGEKAKTTASEEDKSKMCGTQFVGRKKLAANFVAVLKFEFKNKGERDSFSGNLKINVDGFKGKGDVKNAINSASSNAKVSLKVRQVGGDSIKLATLAAEDIAKCSTSKRESCDKAVESIFSYLKTFPAQFDGKPERYFTVANDYRSYDSVDANWKSEKLSPDKLRVLDLNRRAFGEKMTDELGNYNRVEGLVESGMGLSALELGEMRVIQDVIRARLGVYANAAQKCYTSTWETCDQSLIEADAKIKTDPNFYYDVTKLVIIPSDMSGWCGKLNQYGKVLGADPLATAVADTILTSKELYTLSKIFDVLKPDGKTLGTDPAVKNALLNTVGSVPCNIVVFSTRATAAAKINLSQSTLDNIDPVASLEYTREIDLSQNYLTDVLPLAKMRFLEVLNLSSNRISSIDGLASTYLTSLNLSNNTLTSPIAMTHTIGTADKVFRQISGIPTLEVLNLSSNKFLTRMNELKLLPSLKELNLKDTGIDRVALAELLDRRDTDFPSLSIVNLTGGKLKCADVLARYTFVTCQ